MRLEAVDGLSRYQIIGLRVSIALSDFSPKFTR